MKQIPSSDRPAGLHQTHDQGDQCDDEQNMDEIPADWEGEPAQEPGDDQNYDQGFEHFFSPFRAERYRLMNVLEACPLPSFSSSAVSP